MSITAMKTALNALELATTPLAKDRQEVLQAITALRTAIAEAEKVEPVGRIASNGYPELYKPHSLPAWTLLYLAAGAQPVQQEPVAWDIEESVLAIHRIVKSAASFSTKEGALRSELKSVFLAGRAQPAPKQEPVPEGYQLVPVEPTDKMVQASLHLDLSYMPLQEGYDRAAIYKAMLAAAPTQAQPAKPLTEKQMEDMRGEANCGYCIEKDDYYKAVRDTEAAHGIKEQP